MKKKNHRTIQLLYELSRLVITKVRPRILREMLFHNFIVSSLAEACRSWRSQMLTVEGAVAKVSRVLAGCTTLNCFTGRSIIVDHNSSFVLHRRRFSMPSSPCIAEFRARQTLPLLVKLRTRHFQVSSLFLHARSMKVFRESLEGTYARHLLSCCKDLFYEICFRIRFSKPTLCDRTH